MLFNVKITSMLMLSEAQRFLIINIRVHLCYNIIHVEHLWLFTIVWTRRKITMACFFALLYYCSYRKTIIQKQKMSILW